MIQNPGGNTYYECSKRSPEPVRWDPLEAPREKGVEPGYLHRAAASMENALEVTGLVFYVTPNTRELPSYGQNVVAVVVGDESCRIPLYAHRVGAIFKCYGTTLGRGSSGLPRTLCQLLDVLHFGRNWLRRLPSVLHYRAQQARVGILRQRLPPNVYDIPLGYRNQLDLPCKAPAARRYDVGFAGSVDHQSYPFWSPKAYVGTPKSCSRRQMIASVRELARQHPEYEVKLSTTSSFKQSWKADPRTYSDELMDTKVCLVPRGASLETYRFFEAVRYGCVIVAETLPRRWFYDGSPAVQVEDWASLPRLLPGLLEASTLESKHEEALRWWETRCSEDALGAYMAQVLNRRLAGQV